LERKRSHKNKVDKRDASGTVIDPENTEPGQNGQAGEVKGQRKQPKKKKKK
jgi:YidC/Oxa1 family membrane protein insertase